MKIPASTVLVAMALAAFVLPAAGAASQPPTTITLSGVAVQLEPGTRQVITVNRTSGSHARIAFWRRLGDGRWVRPLVSGRARIGYGGLVVASQRHQGTGTTPVGTYRLISAFGTGADASGWRLPYRRIRPQSYWVEDNRSPYYNRWRSRYAGGFRWWLDPERLNGSERLADYPTEYQMAIVTSFNYDNPVRNRGAGIFLHVNGTGATAGCVSAPAGFLRSALHRLQPDLLPVIAIGP
ncbi:MAG: secreted protein [Marmoricola sp.]|nr:secreted protein [Marmoricola sp.]